MKYIKSLLKILLTLFNQILKRLIGIKTISLCFKYGSDDVKENFLLQILKTDVALLPSLKFGHVLVKKIFTYCKKSKTVKLFAQYFEENFKLLLLKTISRQSLDVYLKFLSREKMSKLLIENVPNVVFSSEKISDL